MEQLIFDNGIQEYQINGDKVLRFNPSDPNVYARFMGATEKIAKVEKEMGKKAKALSEKEAHEAGSAALTLMKDADAKMKAILNEIFGLENDFDKILNGVNLMAVGSNGERVVTNLLNALQPIMEAGARDCVGQEVAAAKLNREQRRAMQ